MVINMKDELEQKIAEFYLKEYGSMNHFEYVRNELIEATSEFKKTSEDNYYEETYSFITDIYLPIYIESILNNEFKTELISFLNFIEDYLNKEYNLSLKE